MAHILLLHASVGMGHQRAAAAIAQALGQLPGVTAQLEDTLDYTHPLFRRSYRGSYLSLADRIPGVWSGFYRATDRVFPSRGVTPAPSSASLSNPPMPRWRTHWRLTSRYWPIVQ